MRDELLYGDSTIPGQPAGAVPHGLAPCPQCRQWQWRLGLLEVQCAACGFWERPRPQHVFTLPP
jgi:hypothetical protein